MSLDPLPFSEGLEDQYKTLRKLPKRWESFEEASACPAATPRRGGDGGAGERLLTQRAGPLEGQYRWFGAKAEAGVFLWKSYGRPAVSADPHSRSQGENETFPVERVGEQSPRYPWNQKDLEPWLGTSLSIARQYGVGRGVMLFLACLQEKLPTSMQGKAAKAFSDLARHYRVLLAPKQQEQGLAWIWQEDYQENRNSVALVLDVLGRLKGPAVNEEISAFLFFKDPRLRMFAVFGALRNGIPVNDSAINNIAASAEVRNWFYRGLDEIGRTDVYPKEYSVSRLSPRVIWSTGSSSLPNWLGRRMKLS